MNNMVYTTDTGNEPVKLEYNAVTELPHVSTGSLNTDSPVSKEENTALLAVASILLIILVIAAALLLRLVRKNDEKLDFNDDGLNVLRETRQSGGKKKITDSFTSMIANRILNMRKSALPEKGEVRKNKPSKPHESRYKLGTPKTMGKCIRMFLERTKDI